MFDALIHQANRLNLKLAVLLFDIDYFKAINDRFGHQQGDQVLVEVAKATQKSFGRASDFIFRIGGEEFIVVTEFNTASAFEEHLNKFQQAIRDLNIPNPGSHHKVVTVSVGALFVESFNHQMINGCLYSQLDQLMYAAKSSGRDKLRLEVLTDEKGCSEESR